MNPYILYTDSACDISPELLTQWGVRYRSLTFQFTDAEDVYPDTSVPADDFYKEILSGRSAKTAAVNAETFQEAFEPELQQGNDILYLGFSSGLSSTYNSGRLAMEELRAQYPERKMIAVDTLAASSGFGLLVYLAVQKKNEGATIEEVAQYITDIRLNLCHWFTVDDLKYLRMGGRISPTVAIVGSLLNVKPILHVDDEGHLINMSKVRGRRAAIKTLAEKVRELSSDTSAPIFISQAACLDDANYLKEILETEQQRHVELISNVGPVIGSHSGPGTLAIFFLGVHR
jgi:DegV family protein with EDD domain